MKVMERFPILVWAGAALLGWVAGEIIVKDAAVDRLYGPGMVSTRRTCGRPASARSWWWRWAGDIRRAKHRSPLEHPLIVDPPGPEEFPPRAH